MFKSTSTKNKVLWFVSLSLMVFMSVLILNIYLSKKEELLLEEKVKKTNAINAYKTILKDYENFYQNRLRGIVTSPGVVEALKDNDREKLYFLIQSRWNILKKENIDLSVLHFHKPDGRSFLRMHKPESFGDDISEKRAMCAYIHKNQKPISAFEAGINLLGYRVMIPIFSENIYIGAVEIGTKPHFVLNQMSELYGIFGAVFAEEANIYNKEHVDETKIIINNYRLDSNSFEHKEIIASFPEDYKLDTDIRLSVDDTVYDSYLLEHKDFKGVISAKTLIFNDITSLESNFKEAILKIVFFALLFYIILIVTIKLGFEKILDKIDSTNKELQNSVAFLESHQLAMDESSIVTKSDLKGNMIYVNDNFCKVTGYNRKELIGKPHSLVRHPDNSKKVFKELWETIKSKKVWKGVLKNKGKYSDYWVDTAILPILDKKGDIVEYIAVRHDITKMILQQNKLDNMVNTDFLTGLGSRYKLTNDINKSIKPALAILNVDAFSQINDFYGHEKGDLIIVMLSSIINSIVDNSYNLYHLQGDEFVIFNKNISQDDFLNNISKIPEKISSQPIKIEEEEVDISLTTAISFEVKETILSTADMALKIAKKENKSFIVYDENFSLNGEYTNNIKWAKKIKKAIETDNITPVYQPIVNNTNNKWEKYEALVRLKDDDGKLISPFFFLEISKKTRHYTEITKIMIQKSFDMFKEKDLEFSINLTIEDILNDQINRFIIAMLEEYKIGSRVVFEIVESESIENFEQIHDFIEKVKSYNCKIAIDDFGTGYSNFEYLLKLKVDYIKIDGSMIKDIDTNEEAQLVVSTIIDFAKKIGVKTIAEFVENESILNKVKEMGIDYSQGYHFSAPQLELAME